MLRVIPGWGIDFYQIKDGSTLIAQRVDTN